MHTDVELAAKIGNACQQIFVQILNERFEQERKWGEQNHPSVVAHPRGNLPRTPEGRCQAHMLPTVEAARGAVETMAKSKQLTWADIMVEELCEAIAAPNDKVRREELIQVAAVALAWIECIDRRVND